MEPQKLSFPQPIKTSNRKRRLWFMIIGLLSIGLIGGFISWYVVAHRSKTAITDSSSNPTTNPAPQPALVPSLINGVLVSSDLADRRPVAVMIENSEPARPQVGLTSADVVYEAVTEGGITRFMGIFSQTLPTKAGPIRSARSYFIDYLSEYDAMYVHEGGSPTALSRIAQYNIKDAGSFTTIFHREPQPGLASEHTLFADVSKAWQLGTQKGWSATNDFQPWQFKDPSTTPGAAGNLTIDFSAPAYKVVWNYDPAKNQYNRNLAGSPHKDRITGEQIAAKTIVTMVVQHSPNGNYSDTGHEAEWSMTTIGTGKASVFVDGKQIDGTWKKPSRTDRTRFYDSNNKEIQLNRGKIWIEVVPQTGTYSYQAATT